MKFSFRKVELPEALEIVSWQYPPPYELYNATNSAQAINQLLQGFYYVVFNEGSLMGFFCYAHSARLSGHKKHALYADSNYLDVGLGLHPHFCDQGLGFRFVQAGLVFAQEQAWKGGFRLTVASNNLRALKVYARLNFQEAGRITWDPRLSLEFLVLTLDRFAPN